MHKFAALRRVFHSASRQGRLATPSAACAPMPSPVASDVSPVLATSSSAKLALLSSAPKSAVEAASKARRHSPSSIFHLTVPPIPAPLAEPVKASPNDYRAAPSKLSSQRTAAAAPHSKRSREEDDPNACSARASPPPSSPPTADETRPRSGGGATSLVAPYQCAAAPQGIDQNIYQELRDAFKAKPNVNTFDLVKTVGTGSFGRVYMAKIRERSGAPPVAIKRLTKAAVMKQKQVDHVLSEKNILARVEHPFLVRMYTTFQDLHFLYIVMEYVEGGEFFTFLRKSKRLDSQSARFYAGHVTSIFEYLHPLNIIYRDLKPENLLITRSGYLKLTDFGFAKVVDQRTFTLCGTPEYIAPEVLLNKGHGKPVDWWTLGILVYEMIVGYPPFFDEDALGIYQKILAGKIVFPRFFQRDAKSLVKRLLTHDLTRRSGRVKDGISDVRSHRWFESFDFNALNAQTLEPPYIPNVKTLDDTSNFGNYSEAADHNRLVKEDRSQVDSCPDPFIDW